MIDSQALVLQFTFISIPVLMSGSLSALASQISDRQVLMELFNADGLHCVATATAPLYSWEGVFCNSSDHIVGVNVFSDGLSAFSSPIGQLVSPPTSGPLPQQMIGGIPAELGNLSSLRGSRVAEEKSTCPAQQEWRLSGYLNKIA